MELGHWTERPNIPTPNELRNLASIDTSAATQLLFSIITDPTIDKNSGDMEAYMLLLKELDNSSGYVIK